MTATVNTSLKSVNVSASLEASDHSGGALFWRRNGGHSNKKKLNKPIKKAFFEGSVSMATWGIYADLAALLDAICLLQTQSTFLNQAKSALERMKRLSNQPETGRNKPGQSTTSTQLAAFITDVFYKTGQMSSLNEYENPTNSLSKTTPKQLQSNVLNNETDWDNLGNVIQQRLDLLDHRKEHLMGLAQSARLRIEEINNPCVIEGQQNLNDATNRTLNELHSASFKAFQSQTVRLPKTVLSLVNN